MGRLKVSLQWEGGRSRRRYRFAVPQEKGEVSGQVDDSATGPVYAVQHCVVDTFDGRIVLPPTTDEAQADDLAARLNAGMVEGEG
ncbi:MAG TPA: hypothetical protein VGK66_01860 [Solirubrobacterales bacterium]|nr:hypothetical protein [Solirubrobacterales bacterium]